MTSQDKAIMFLSAPKKNHVPYFHKYGISSLLISYWYVRKNKSLFYEIADYVKSEGGYLMIDSGAHTFKHDADRAKWEIPENYMSYINELLQFCYDNAKNIFCTVNMDMDNWVGTDVVDNWNEKYFRPLDKVTNVIFNVDSVCNRAGLPDPTYGMARFREYVKEYKYIGINGKLALHAPQVFSLAQKNGVKVHGFALTRLNLLRAAPMFSVDSSSWLSGSRFGVTYQYDGANFKTHDKSAKYRRKGLKIECRDNDINYTNFIGDKNETVTEWNIKAWAGFEKEYLQSANRKLRTLPASFYDKRGK